MNIWRKLTHKETLQFVEWTLCNWTPRTQINELWHPVIKRTWDILDEAFNRTKIQIMADYNELICV